jgi:hypothetical protein
VSHEVIVNLISATTTQTGLKVWAELDTNSYPPGAQPCRTEGLHRQARHNRILRSVIEKWGNGKWHI